MVGGGRVTVAALAATTTAGYGVLFYAYGVLLVPMQEDLDWRRSTLSGAFSLALIVSALMTVPVGRWLDRHQPRPLLLVGAVGGSVLVALWSRADNILYFYAVWFAIGACMAVVFYEPAFAVLTKWLHGPDRHRAVTAVTLVAGLASTIFGPLTAALERAVGWRGAALALACLFAAVTIPAFTFALKAPAATALGGAPTKEVAVVPSARPRDAMVAPRFWYLTGAYLLSAVTTFAVAVHLVAYLRGRGWTSTSAATALGAIGFVQVVGRSAFSTLTARVQASVLGTWVLATKAVGLAALLVVPGLAGVVVFVAVYGAANGLQTLTRATVVAELYGADHYGAIAGMVASVGAVGGAVSPVVFAAAADVIGSDDAVLWALVAISAASAALHRPVRQTGG